jgi:hypothetical protein
MGKDTLDSEEIREDNRKGIILVSISLIIESASSVLIQILTRSSNPVEPLDIVMIRSVA